MNFPVGVNERDCDCRGQCRYNNHWTQKLNNNCTETKKNKHEANTYKWQDQSLIIYLQTYYLLYNDTN